MALNYIYEDLICLQLLGCVLRIAEFVQEPFVLGFGDFGNLVRTDMLSETWTQERRDPNYRFNDGSLRLERINSSSRASP